MKRVALAFSVAALLGIARPAVALGPLCCACLPDPKAHTSGNTGAPVGALFCAAAPPATLDQLDARCLATPEHGLRCVAVIPGTPCVTELASEGVSCPSAGAPVAAPVALLALAASLAAAGTLAARRRHRGD
jgi:hypothetical protein